MQLQYVGSLQLAEMASAFPTQMQPVFAQTDYAINLTPNSTSDFQSLKVEELLNCCTTQPLFVPHNQVNTAGATIVDDGTYIRGALPSVNWSTINLSGTGGIQAFAYRPWGYQHFDILCTDETQAHSMALTAKIDPSYSWPGYTFWCTRNHFHYADGSTTPASVDLQFTVTALGTAYIYSILSGTGQYAQLRRSANGGSTWKVLNGKVKLSDSPLSFLGNSNPESATNAMLIEVLAFNGMLLISLGGQTSPFVTALPNPNGIPQSGPIDSSLAYPPISNITVISNNFTQFQWHLHPTKFAATGSYTSGDITIGFVPDDSTPAYGRITGLTQAQTVAAGDTITENGATIAYDTDPEGPTMQYQVTITNPTSGSYNGQSYSDDSAGIVRVSTHIDGISQAFAYVTQPVIPKEIYEVIRFDLNSLSLSHELYVTLDNWAGIDAWLNSVGLRGYGNIGVSMRLGWLHQGPSPYDGLPGYQHFFGYCDTYNYERPSDQQALLRLSCVDQMQWLADDLIAAPPDMDGWNHYYAIAWIAMHAGITIDQMAFADLVPDDPLEATDRDQNPYFLPRGEGMHPWTPRDRTLPSLQLAEFIRKATGFLLYIDAYGYLRYEPLIPPSQIPVAKVYREVSDDGYGYAGGAVNWMGRLNLKISTRDTRNQVVLVGIDSYGPDWNPIVIKLEDQASIFTPPGYTPPFNSCGYRKPLVWLDSRFANTDFASDAAQEVFDIVRLPDYQCNLSSWLQPEIFPMMNIMVDDPKSNSFGVPFFVTQVINHLSVMGGNLTLDSQLTGKMLLL